MSLACSLYTIRPVRRTRGLGFGGLEGRKADAATEPYWTSRPEAMAKDSYMYNDMRRIRIEALLLYVMK